MIHLMTHAKLAACALLATSLLLAMPADAQHTRDTTPTATPTFEPAQVRKVELLLSGYHAIPSKAELDAVSPKAELIVNALVSAQDTSPFIMPRAISSLVAHWPNARTLTTLRSKLNHPKLADATRHQLLLALPALGAQVIPDLLPYLSHADDQLRMSAAHALGQLNDHDLALKALHDALDAERDPVVREAIERAARAIR
jgi:HEAT repeat protein